MVKPDRTALLKISTVFRIKTFSNLIWLEMIKYDKIAFIQILTVFGLTKYI